MEIDEVRKAYKKFKNYCFYDNSSLFNSQKIAELEDFYFQKSISSQKSEEPLEVNFQEVCDIIEKEDFNNDCFKKIKCFIVPKSGKDSSCDKKSKTNESYNDESFIILPPNWTPAFC